MARFAALGVAASVQFSHAPSDRDLADRVWEGSDGRLRVPLAAGRRHACWRTAPTRPWRSSTRWRGIVAGVLRTLDERPAWRPEQAVTVEEALEATCVAPAWLAHDEHRRGALRPGMLADLVVLDRDPLTCAPEELPELRVLATMVGGRWTYGEL